MSDTERVAARVEQGLPESLQDVTDDQRRQFVGQANTGDGPVSTSQAEVVAMEENSEGEATA